MTTISGLSSSANSRTRDAQLDHWLLSILTSGPKPYCAGLQRLEDLKITEDLVKKLYISGGPTRDRDAIGWYVHFVDHMERGTFGPVPDIDLGDADEIDRQQDLEKSWREAEFMAKQELQTLRARTIAKEWHTQEIAQRQLTGDEDSRVVKGGSILDEPEGVPAVWGSGDNVLWAQGQGMMITSHQGVGKTTIAQQLTLWRIGIRFNDAGFLGYPINDDGRSVVYLAMDRPAQAFSSFRRMLTEEDREILDQRMVLRKGPLPVDALSSIPALADYVQLICPDVGTVVIDSVKDMVGGRSLSSDEVGAGINSSVQEVLARGVEVVLLHHHRKAQNGSERFNTLDDVFGSTLITSGLGSIFALRGLPGTLTPELIHLKQPVMPVEMMLRHDHKTGTTSIENGAVESIDMLREAGDLGMTLVDIALRRFGRAEKTDTQKIKRELKEYLASGRVKVVPGFVSSSGRSPDRYFINVGQDSFVQNLRGEI